MMIEGFRGHFKVSRLDGDDEEWKGGLGLRNVPDQDTPYCSLHDYKSLR